MQQLHRLLYLDPGDDGGNSGRSRHAPLGVRLVQQQIARHTPLEDCPVNLPQRAFITRSPTRQKSAGYSVNAFYCAIYPGPVGLPRGAIDPKPRLAIIEPCENKISPGKKSESTF